jgi:hypothetical protein
MAEKILIAELAFDTTALIKSAEEAQLALDKLKDEQIALGQITDENTKAFIENEVAQKKVRAELTAHKNALTSLTDTTGKQVDVTGKMNTELGKEVKTIDQARASNKELTAIRNKLNLTTNEGRLALVDVNEKLDKNNKFIKDNADAYTKQKIGIGDYEGALRRVFPALGSVIDGLKDVKDGLIAKQTVMKASIVPTMGLSGALKVLKYAFFSIGIGLIVGALGSLITFLMSTQAGIDAVTSVTRPLQAVLSSLLGVVQNVGGALFEAFSKPKVLLNDLVNFMKGQLINRFKAFAVILEGIKDFDTKKISDGLFQLTLGVENVSDKVANFGKEAGKFLGDAVAKGKEMDRLQKEIEKSNLRYSKNQIAVKDELDKQLLISKDTSKSFAEREKAAKRIIEINKQNGAEEAKIIQMEIDRLSIEQSLNDTKRTGQQEMIDLQKRLDDAKDRGVEAEKEQMRVLAGARKEAQKEALDNIKSQADAKKEADKKIIDDKKIKDEAEKAELERLKSFEDKKRNLINEIDLQNATTDEAKSALKLTQDLENQLIELERIEATETEKGELKKLIIEKYNNDVNDLIQNAANERAKIQADADIDEIELQKLKGEASLQIAQQIAGQLLGLLGDSLAGQLASIALNAIIDIAKIKIATSAAQAINLANGTAMSIPTGGASLVAAKTTNIALGATSKVQQGMILASAAISGAGATAKKIKKAEKGGLFKIGGKRHSQGGTKFWGEDGTNFEAERDELIGVMSRSASEKFMQFNNQHTPNTISRSNYFATGGIVQQQNGLSQTLNDVILNLPTPIVDVKDIISEVNNRISLVDGASR